MNYREALSEAVAGERVRAVDMPEGVYIDYQFNGWRINFPSGSSSGYSSKPHDETVEWEVYVKPEPKGWDMALVKPPEPPEPVKRRGRKAWVPPAEINDIDDAVSYPMVANHSDEAAFAAQQALEKAISNPWAEAGLTSEEKPVSGWADYGKGNS